MAETPLLAPTTWRSKPLYACPCGYTTFSSAKFEAHRALPHAAMPDASVPVAPPTDAEVPATRATPAVGTAPLRKGG